MAQNTSFTIEYNVPAEVMYRTLTDQMELCKMQQGPAVSEPRPEGRFKLYDGTITGMYVELEENKKIVMKWRMKDWACKDGSEPDAMDLDVKDAANCFSNVTLEFLASSDSGCEIKLT